MKEPEFDVFVFIGGKYCKLTERCFESLTRLISPHVRFWLSATDVCSTSRKLIDSFAENLANPVVNVNDKRVCKYAAWRNLLMKDAVGKAPYCMVWEDDTVLATEDGIKWLQLVSDTMRNTDADVLGSLRSGRIKNAVECESFRLLVEAFPWYRGEPIYKEYNFVYPDSGWLVMKHEIITKYAWPPTALNAKRGGSLLLGELCRQQQLKLVDFFSGIKPNADDRCNEGFAPKRESSFKLVGV